MMNIARDQAADDNATKQEAGGDEHEKTNSKASSSSSWSRLKDPRIVRVSKAFGGKDRHSKVCTVRGLRDRRVRLSVPTAIQLYDLQDRLGLNQPSKVVDWLLDAAKHEIDELPPLQMPPPGSLISHNLQPLLSNHFQSKGPRIGTINWTDPSEPSGSNNNSTWNSKSKEIEDHNYVTSNTIGPNLIRWDPSSTLSLSQSGGLNPHHHQQHQEDNNFHNFNVVSSGGIAQSYFPSHFNFNFQMLNSNSVTPTIDTSASSQQGRPFHMSTTTANFLPTPEDRGNGLANNEGDFRSR